MFEWLFGQPWTAFAKGGVVLLRAWPLWLLLLAAAAGCALLAALTLRTRTSRRAVLWALQGAFLGVLLLALWRPAVSFSTLKPQANVVTVLVDDSRSMAIREDGRSRSEAAAAVLNGGVLKGLRDRFQVRLYRFSSYPERIQGADALRAGGTATRIGEALSQVASDAPALPIGAVLLLSDGGDNSGAVDPETVARLRRYRIPVHTVGFGREAQAHDIEITGASLPARTLTGSRVMAAVSLRSAGYAGRRARIVLRDGAKVVASRDVTLKNGEQAETLAFSAGQPGARAVEAAVEPLEGEENAANNRLNRLLAVEPRKPRILYVEGEPRWEYKFLRRAVEDDGTIEVVSILRTSQNKLYRQGIKDPGELESGFPTTAEELFAFDGLILGSVDAGWFTPGQQGLIRDFADRRGGGVLFLGGRASLADGGYGPTPLADLVPAALPEKHGTFHRDPATLTLTAAGRESALLRLVEAADANAARWTTMPPLADYQELGKPKPGATVLAEMSAGGRTGLPLLVIQNYGRGRTAVLATGGTWRWQMRQDHADQTHETFWRQVLRWLVTDTPGRVTVTTPKNVLSDEQRLPLRAEVRDKAYRPVTDARVEARLIGPGGESSAVELLPKSDERGVYVADTTAAAPGSYVAEVAASRGNEDLGRDVITVRREDGVAENFRTEQNRELLERLAEQTGGRYYRPQAASKLGREIEYSEAGITVRQTRDLWNVPAMLLLALALRSAEWLLRRKWGWV